jgi:hypothetical protein
LRLKTKIIMNFKKINNITGWFVFAIATTVYLMTMEASGSLWDCGEFASSAFKVQNPHPPGAPLFVLIGRLFMIPFGAKNAVLGINAMSALSSSFTILFLFWTITHFAKKIVLLKSDDLDKGKVISIMAAGVVGALAYTFSDSFWYSAVEAEVYALSSLFTAVVFWAILKWEQAVTDEQAAGIKGKFTKADRWIILIFYLMGLSIGVHLLNLLSLPAIVIVYYFKRFKPTLKGTIIALLAGCVITGFVQKAVIQWSIKLGSSLDVTFVNDMSSPFFLGFGFFFVLLALFLFLIIRVAVKNNLHFLSLGTWSFSFMLLGYLSYLTPLIRSNADTSIDMFNVDNPISLFGYVGREQYGDWPLLYGQDFTARPIDYEEGEDVYVKKSDTYEKVGNKFEPVFDKEDKHLFPRMWDMSNDRGQASFYASWANIEQVGSDEYGRPIWDRSPTFSENLSYFVGYQLNWMYLRYFMWNS